MCTKVLPLNFSSTFCNRFSAQIFEKKKCYEPIDDFQKQVNRYSDLLKSQKSFMRSLKITLYYLDKSWSHFCLSLLKITLSRTTNFRSDSSKPRSIELYVYKKQGLFGKRVKSSLPEGFCVV